MASPYMLIVTEVAPYADGPAGVHGVLGQAATALTQLASLHSLTSEVITDVRDLTVDQLSSTGVIVLFTIGETRFSPTQKATLVRNWTDGRTRLLGIHSATDACYGWDDYEVLIGGRFDGHPWTQAFEIEVLEPDHPATRHLGSHWRWHDEVYLFRSIHHDARILLRVAEGQLDMAVPGARRPAHGFPLAWCRTAGPARTFYSALGHFPGAWETPAFLRHLDGALSWLLEDLDQAPQPGSP